jgi:hypothetical protein
MGITKEQGAEIVKFLLPYVEKCDNDCNGCMLQDRGELCLVELFAIRVVGK